MSSCSSTHCFAIAIIIEKYDDLKWLTTEMGLSDSVNSHQGQFYETETGWYPLDIFFCVDWQELKSTPGNTCDYPVALCPFCGLNKHYLTTAWYTKPFEFEPCTLTLDDWPNAILNTLPVNKRTYCWMHDVANLLSNTIKLIYNSLLQKTEFKSIMEKIMKRCWCNWSMDTVLTWQAKI